MRAVAHERFYWMPPLLSSFQWVQLISSFFFSLEERIQWNYSCAASAFAWTVSREEFHRRGIRFLENSFLPILALGGCSSAHDLKCDIQTNTSIKLKAIELTRHSLAFLTRLQTSFNINVSPDFLILWSLLLGDYSWLLFDEISPNRNSKW